ncbi:MAG TPA: hypothetical protein VM554_02395 [Acidisarcina sp.]|nr:hypothetical protein [Acidisarcina sp.]
MKLIRLMLISACLLPLASQQLLSQAGSQFGPGARVLADAHNCYPYNGRWNDRIERALSTGFPIAIEQDLALYTDPRTGMTRVVVAHDLKSITGAEPTLREHFFERIKPVMEEALRRPSHSQWPLITLNLDFKSNDPALIVAVRELLKEYRPWLTTAVRGEKISDQKPVNVGPLLVVTGTSDVQQRIFYDELPVGSDLLVFGAVHVNGANPMAAPEVLVSVPANNYRRWWNNPWSVVEDGGQRKAGEWTETSNTRLRALVQHSHQLGYWIRFYTLDGGSKEQFQQNGWFENYNFGSLQAAEIRWKAAKEAGVDFIASDQYETLATLVRGHVNSPVLKPGK